MSNFAVNAIYNYSSANVYSYLGRVPVNEKKLEEAFDKFNVTPTGRKDDLEKLDNAMYAAYSEQVKSQMANQNAKNVVPWAGLMAQIGVQASGHREKDYAAFNEAIQLLSQSAIDGQAMAYFAGLRSEAQKVFGMSSQADNQPVMSFEEYQALFL